MKYWISPAILFLSTFVFAQNKLTQNTLKLNGDPPAASIEDVAWLSGYWTGKAFDGEFEEIWSQPFGNTMMGSYKLVVNGEVNFYEILTIVEEERSLVLKLKHFNRDLTGWEEKNESVDFPLVRFTPEKAFFQGMTFEKINSHQMKVFLAIKQKNGDFREEVFEYNKKEY